MDIHCKADAFAERCISFTNKHPSARYFCVSAVSAVYFAEYLRRRICSVGSAALAAMERLPDKLGLRIVSAAGAAAFAMMTAPVQAFGYNSLDAAPAEIIILPEPAPASPQNIPGLYGFDPTATPRIVDELRINSAVLELTGDAEENIAYEANIDVKALGRSMTLDFSGDEDGTLAKRIKKAFKLYGISTDNLNIEPMNISMYRTDTSASAQLKNGVTADITVPVPENMQNNLADLKVIRVESDGTITILDSTAGFDDRGCRVSFSTEHFSLFALVAYNEEVTVESVESGSGSVAQGILSVIAPPSQGAFDSDKRRRKYYSKQRRIYRIKRICKESDLLI